MDLQTLKRQFLEHIEIEKGRSVKTVENYDRYISRFLDFLQKKEPKDITESVMREYRLWLNRQSTGNNRFKNETLKKKTQNYYLIALRAFLKFLAKRGFASLSPEYIELAKTPERSLDLISRDELKRLFDAPNFEKDEEKKARGKAILALLFSTGLRVSELCALSREIDLHSEELTVRGKGGKVRLVFISEDARQALKNYLHMRKDMSDALFVKISKEKAKAEESGLARRSIERIVKEYAIRAGISKKVTPHVIRHCFATDLLYNGADLRSVQVLLGHANIATTQIYTHITDKHLKEVHKKFHGKSE